MCLAVPMRLVELQETLGIAEIDGVRREVSLMLQPEAKVGDYVLVHAGYAIGLVDEAEANATLELLRQVAGAMEDL
ncbi:MAG: HypC/HybG/HupF family hydrogenase formation chaperone [Acidobacteriia bacterium]|nr:HypC/HybG/HupF family hydrogenase formation chaperone [Terriglobia bacterium]